MNLYNTGASLTNSLDIVANSISLINPDGSLNNIYTITGNAIKFDGGIRIQGDVHIGDTNSQDYTYQQLIAYGGIVCYSGFTNSGILTTTGDVTFNTDTTSTGLTNALASKANLSGCTFTGPVLGLTKATVGLENVENTTDLNKVISTATQTALNTKANLSGANTLTGLLNANGGISVNNYSLPLFNNGSAGASSNTLVIPIYLTSSFPYNFVEIKVGYKVSASCDITLSGNTGSTGGGTNLPVGENSEVLTANTTTSYASTNFTTTGKVATACASLGMNHQFRMTITKGTGAAGGTFGVRNCYLCDTSYTQTSVGTTRINGQGIISSNSLASIVLTTSTGFISATWNTVHYY